jgi:hypothetical protein
MTAHSLAGPPAACLHFWPLPPWVEFDNSLDDPAAFHRLVCGIYGLEPGTDSDRALYDGQCPYRGLRVFNVDDAPFFFGREALVQWLLNEVRPATESLPLNRFLAIVGASGSGKSSVARAGLIAALRRDATPGSALWPVAIFRPGPDPLESLAVALSRVTTVRPGASALGELIAEFEKSEKTLQLNVRQSLPENSPEMRLVIVVDQFEEVFTQCRREELREALIHNLLYAAKVIQGQTLVILTMRADFYGKCASNAELAAAISDHHVLVGPMTEEELHWAIERPAQLVGCELEAGLVDLLAQDVRRQARRSSVAAARAAGTVEQARGAAANYQNLSGDWKAGRRLAKAGRRNATRLWDLTAKNPAANPIVLLRGYNDTVNAVAISADSHWLVTGSEDNTVRLWDLWAKAPSANPVLLRGHEGAVRAVAISADNHWLVTGSEDKTTRLWDLTKDPAASPVVLYGEGAVDAVAISADNRWVVTGGKDKTARLWPLQIKDLMDLARFTVGRNFSVEEWNLYFPGEPYQKTLPALPGP